MPSCRSGCAPKSPGLPKGLAYDVYVDVLAEFGRNARVGTWLIRVFRESSRRDRVAHRRLNILTTVRGLYRLSLSSEKQYRIVNLALSAEDFELRVPSGVGFVAETDAGVTGIVILGRGEMTFSPTPAAEKGQVRIYSGGDAHTTSFDWVYLRAHPAEFDRRLDVSTFHAREVDPRDLRRAEAVFQENLPLSFGIELADLSRERWSVIPKFGDLVAEMNTNRAHLTYMKSVNDAEDIRFIDRTRSRTISIYPSKEKLATRGPFFDEDDQVDFDIVNYDIDASFDPRREWIDGKATLLVTARRDPISSLVLTLAEPLTVRSVTSKRHGYLMALRVSGQDDIIINLPEPLRPDELLDLEFVYGGRLPAIPPEREAIEVGRRRYEQANDFFNIQALPSYIYTGRSGWYPQGDVTDYATATLRLRVPEGYSTVASGSLDQGYPKTLPPEGRVVVGRVSLQRHATRALSGMGHQPLRSRRLRVVLDRCRRGRRCPVDGRVVHVRRDHRRVERPSAAQGARAVRRDAARDEVLRVGRLRHSIPELHAGDRRAGSAGRPQSAVFRDAQSSAAGNAHFVAHRSGVLRRLSGVLSGS